LTVISLWTCLRTVLLSFHL
jgi:Outer membrane cobalamin receptor protein